MSMLAEPETLIQQPVTEPRLVVVLDHSPAVAAMLPTVATLDPVSEIAERYGVVLRPGFRPPGGCFTPARDSLRLFKAAAAEAPAAAVDLSVFYRVDAPAGELDELAERLMQDDRVAGAYVEPGTSLPTLNTMGPASAPAPSSTPDFTPRQTYLGTAPDGIGVSHAWGHPGGRGANVRIIDVEVGWNLAHETLAGRTAALYGGAPRDGSGAGRNHGTAVIGVTSAAGAGFGVTGICPDAGFATFSNFGGYTSSEAIQAAADLLDPGDVLIIEMHRPGPRYGFAQRADQVGFIPVEWWPYDFAAIQYAVARGIVVLETAGNGWENLDDAVYDARPAGFPPGWANPFRRWPADSGAILIGAGAPPPGTHGRNHGPARSRLDFSNYGGAVDAQGWGREVTTCGYGHLQGGPNENVWYTDDFMGTSSAAPIVAGALACVQGIRKAAGRGPLTPAQARALLRNPATGSPQVDGPAGYGGTVHNPATQRIGALPDLGLLVPAALALP